MQEAHLGKVLFISQKFMGVSLSVTIDQFATGALEFFVGQQITRSKQ